jgi:hypothetical protein
MVDDHHIDELSCTNTNSCAMKYISTPEGNTRSGASCHRHTRTTGMRGYTGKATAQARRPSPAGTRHLSREVASDRSAGVEDRSGLKATGGSDEHTIAEGERPPRHQPAGDGPATPSCSETHQRASRLGERQSRLCSLDTKRAEAETAHIRVRDDPPRNLMLGHITCDMAARRARLEETLRAGRFQMALHNVAGKCTGTAPLSGM